MPLQQTVLLVIGLSGPLRKAIPQCVGVGFPTVCYVEEKTVKSGIV